MAGVDLSNDMVSPKQIRRVYRDYPVGMTVYQGDTPLEVEGYFLRGGQVWVVAGGIRISPDQLDTEWLPTRTIRKRLGMDVTARQALNARALRGATPSRTFDGQVERYFRLDDVREWYDTYLETRASMPQKE